MKTEPLFGRYSRGVVSEAAHVNARASTRPVVRADVEYTSGATGKASVEVLESVDDEDRGGVLLRFRTQDGGSSFLPHAVVTEEGVDLHLAGQAEAAAFLEALRALLDAYERQPAGDADHDVLSPAAIVDLRRG